MNILFWTVFIVVVALVLSAYRLTRVYDPIKTTLQGAQEALKAIIEWAKWMSGIQTVSIGGVAWLLTDSEDRTIKTLTEPRLAFALAGFIFTGIALFCCAWVLSAVPSILSRVNAMQNEEPSSEFDVHETSIFAARSPRLGNMMALQHWLWALGLVFFGALILWPASQATSGEPPRQESVTTRGNLTSSDWISIVNTGVLALTFGAIVVYTWETVRLRWSADRQVQLLLEQQRGSVRPVLLFEFDWLKHRELEHLPLLRNVGAAPALNVQIAPIQISSNECIKFERIPVIRSDGAEPSTVRPFAFKNDGFSENITRASHLVSFLFRTEGRDGEPQVNEAFPKTIPLKITFADLSGYRRTAHYEIRIDDGMERIRVFPGKEI